MKSVNKNKNKTIHQYLIKIYAHSNR